MKKLLSILSLSMLSVPALVQAQLPCDPNNPGTQLCNALPSFGGIPVTNVSSLFTAVLFWTGTVVALIAMVMIIYSGAKMVFAQGDQQAISEAKNSLTYALSGFLVMTFAYVMVSMVQYFIGVNTQQPNNSFFYNPLRDNVLFDGDAPSFVVSTILNLINLIGLIAMFFIILNGFKYMLARGNEEQIAKAKAGVTWSVIGLILTILSYTIISAIIETIG
jgi:hypothetical protein